MLLGLAILYEFYYNRRETEEVRYSRYVLTVLRILLDAGYELVEGSETEVEHFRIDLLLQRVQHTPTHSITGTEAIVSSYTDFSA